MRSRPCQLPGRAEDKTCNRLPAFRTKENSQSRARYTHTMLSVLAICIGASLGALARWGLGLWLSPGAVLPWGTLAANLIGGYLIGACVAVFQALPQLDPVWRLALVTGFLGALTTFSSFSAEVVGMLQQSRYALALGTAALHLCGSLLLTLLGIKTAMLFIAARA
jgi:fluoride exporter